ncbi:MAG: type II 3-dehydroquinate dehydratase [Variovorax sp.]|nr:type II 3-dehydroquinate dehydratase [Variovorax sp.]
MNTPATATRAAPRILLIQGPNLNYLGKRQPELYGTTTAAELDAMVHAHAARHGYVLSTFQTNTEGVALDRIYEEMERGLDGLIMNPGAWSFEGSAMRFCLMSIDRPYVEVHIRNQYQMKHVSTLADLAVGAVQGFGVHSYLLGLDALLHHLQSSTHPLCKTP